MSLIRRVLLTFWPKRREGAAVEAVEVQTPVATSDAALEWTLAPRRIHATLGQRIEATVPFGRLACSIQGAPLEYTLPHRQVDYTLEVAG